MKTKLGIRGDRFTINGALTYSELPGVSPEKYGLLMNARMIQGIFDDRLQPRRFDRFGKTFSPDGNTQELIEALPQWHAMGLRALTVGFQGGGPCFTTDNSTIDNNPYAADGSSMDEAYLKRMNKVIRAADEIGMVVIVSLFYGAQTRFLQDDQAIITAVKTASNWLRKNQYTNVIIEIANEFDVGQFACHPIIYTGKGIPALIEIAQRESGGMPVGCSGTGGKFDEAIARASDVVLIHGNDQSPQKFYNLICKARSVCPDKPIVCNEDSQAISRLPIAVREGISWGYYNNMTKQEPPAKWGISPGEDRFFALRMAECLEIAKAELPLEEQFYLQGLEEEMTYEGKRWIRLASLYPERIDHVDFYRDGAFVGRAYDDPFMLNSVGSNWLQKAFPEPIQKGEVWKAQVYLHDGCVVEKTVTV